MSPLTESTRLTLAKTWDLAGFDADAAAYIQRVEWADTTPLEAATRTAINNFVVGCKADGIWTAIKASCILAGARTLAGALMPLAGAAPTNNNFVTGDYNRKTGLVGDGSTKYLNSNRAGNADPQDSAHATVYRTDTANPGTASFLGSQKASGDRNVTFYTFSGATGYAIRKSGLGDSSVGSTASTSGLLGVSRSSASSHMHRVAGSTTTNTISSIAPDSTSIYIFANNVNGTLATPTNARLAFYSIGESLDLALLDTRVSALITAFGVAIP